MAPNALIQVAGSTAGGDITCRGNLSIASTLTWTGLLRERAASLLRSHEGEVISKLTEEFERTLVEVALADTGWPQKRSRGKTGVGTKYPDPQTQRPRVCRYRGPGRRLVRGLLLALFEQCIEINRRQHRRREGGFNCQRINRLTRIRKQNIGAHCTQNMFHVVASSKPCSTKTPAC
jgi:hypothetical protein